MLKCYLPFFLLFAGWPNLLLAEPELVQASPRRAGPEPLRVIALYRVKIEARDKQGNEIPAYLTIAGTKAKTPFRKSLQDGPCLLNLRSGDTYVVEANLPGYLPVQRSLRLDRLGNPSKTSLILALEMIPEPVSVLVNVVDDRTGMPIQPGFLVQTENPLTGKTGESQIAQDARLQLSSEPSQPLRVLVKAPGYAVQSEEINDTRLTQEVTVRLKAQEDLAIRPYSIRVIGEDYHQAISKYDLDVRDENLQPVSGRLDGFTGDWQVNLKPNANYTLEVKAPGFVPYRDTLTRPDQSTILVILRRDMAPSERQSVAVLDGFTSERVAAAEAAPKPKPAYVSVWEEKLASVDRAAMRLFGTENGRESAAFLPLEHLHFDQSSAVIGEESTAQLDQLADLLVRFPTVKLKLAGHTDRLGDRKLNLFLSDTRAGAVANYLIEKGTDPVRIRYEGFGHSRPLAPSDTEENRQKNRRVEVWVVEK